MFSNKRIIQGLIIISIITFCGVKLFHFFKKKPISTVLPILSEKKDSLVSTILLNEFFDFENYTEQGATIEKASSGKQSYKLFADIEYGFSVIKPVKTIPSGESIKTIDITIKCWTKKNISNAAYVLAIDDTTGKNIFWEGKPIECTTSGWNTLRFSYDLKSVSIKPEYIIKLYPWNKGKEEFFIDDISVNYNGMQNNNDRLTNSNTNFFFDFETTDGIIGTYNIQQTTAHSGKMASVLSRGVEYGPSIIKKVSDVSTARLKKISASIWVFPLSDNPNAVLTTSIVNSKKETVFWDGKGTEKQSFPKNKWTKINASFNLPFEKINSDDVIQVNIWNKGKTDIIVDDLEIIYGDQPERRGVSSTIDPNTFYEKHFIPQKNKPPFKTIYFEKQVINNENSTSINTEKQNDFSPNDEFLVGDFNSDKNKLDEIICIKNGSIGMFGYSTEDKHFKKIWENTNPSDSLWNTNNQAYSGDFNNDGLLDILIVNKKDQSWNVIDFDGKKWILKLKGNKDKINKQWFSKDNVPSLVNKNVVFKNSDIIFSGDYFGNNEKQLLKLNTDRRFDLKLIDVIDNEFNIAYNVDFKGYPDDHNPKYYEFVKIISGKFISVNQSSILVMMRNCADTYFNGVHCNQFENIPYLPNSTQLYTLINE